MGCLNSVSNSQRYNQTKQSNNKTKGTSSLKKNKPNELNFVIGIITFSRITKLQAKSNKNSDKYPT